MTLFFKHIGLVLGVLLIFVSFLFFGRQQSTYQVLVICGLVVAIIFYLIILFGKDHLKSKIYWTVVVVLCAICQQVTEPFLIDTSYRVYIWDNENELTEINNILSHKQGDIFILNDSISTGEHFTKLERDKLREGRKNLGVYMISKSGDKIYYGLWGFLDVRLGITYFIDKPELGANYRHLTGNWVH